MQSLPKQGCVVGFHESEQDWPCCASGLSGCHGHGTEGFVGLYPRRGGLWFELAGCRLDVGLLGVAGAPPPLQVEELQPSRSEVEVGAQSHCHWQVKSIGCAGLLASSNTIEKVCLGRCALRPATLSALTTYKTYTCCYARRVRQKSGYAAYALNRQPRRLRFACHVQCTRSPADSVSGW